MEGKEGKDEEGNDDEMKKRRDANLPMLYLWSREQGEVAGLHRAVQDQQLLLWRGKIPSKNKYK